jgi:predicted small lipoprotein YifL
MKKLPIAFVLVGLLFAAAACSSKGPTDTGKVIKSAPVGNNLTATLSNKDGALRIGDNEFFASFKDSSGKTVEVGAVGLKFQMPGMGTMPAMNAAAAFTATGTPGVYQGKVKLESAGDWQTQLSYEGPAGNGRTSLTVSAQ